MRHWTGWIHVVASCVVVLSGCIAIYGAREIWTGDKILDAKVNGITRYAPSVRLPYNPSPATSPASIIPTYSITFKVVDVKSSNDGQR